MANKNRQAPTVVKNRNAPEAQQAAGNQSIQQHRRPADPHLQDMRTRQLMDDETRQRAQNAVAIYSISAVALVAVAIWQFVEGATLESIMITVVAGLLGGLAYVINRGIQKFD